MTARKVLIVNTSDKGGGAERFTALLREGLESRGVETWMVVGDKRTDDPRVVAIHSSPFIDYRPMDDFWSRAVLPLIRRAETGLGLEPMHFPFTRRLLDMTGAVPDAVVLCNLHGGYVDLRALAALSWRVPMLLRPGDGWPITGHCATPAGCERWLNGCGRCPDLVRPPAIKRDMTAYNWRRKRRIYRRARWAVAAPSDWQMRRLERSILRHADGPRRVIANGVDQTVFSPGDRAAARQALGLAPDRAIALVVANQGAANPFKDFATLRAALGTLTARALPLDVVIVGAAATDERFGDASLRHHGYSAMPEHLATYYRAADFLINLTPEESFSNVLAEAMSCGIPVLSNRVAAVPEIVKDGETGVLVEYGDVAVTAGAIERLALDDAARARMGQNALAHAQRHFPLDLMIDRYLEMIESCIALWPQAPIAAAPPGA